MKLTQWFGQNQKPVHIGIYETDMGAGMGYSKWDGKHWLCEFTHKNMAADCNVKGEQYKKWRGIAK